MIMPSWKLAFEGACKDLEGSASKGKRAIELGVLAAREFLGMARMIPFGEEKMHLQHSDLTI